MSPGQVHSWQFSGEVDGYIVNFSKGLFDSFFKEPNYLDRFSFFGGLGEDQVIDLTGQYLKEVTELFERSMPGVGGR